MQTFVKTTCLFIKSELQSLIYKSRFDLMWFHMGG